MQTQTQTTRTNMRMDGIDMQKTTEELEKKSICYLCGKKATTTRVTACQIKIIMKKFR